MAREPSKTDQGHCPECGPNRFADVKGELLVSEGDDEAGVWLSTTYRVLQCRGCETPYFKKSSVFSEDIEHYQNAYGEWETHAPETVSYWPSPARRDPPKWINAIGAKDTDLGNLMNDVYGALNADLRVPAAIALRTVFDRSSELLGVTPSLSFTEKLRELVDQGKISRDEQGTLTTLTDAGSAAAHRGWRPTVAELETMASIVETFMHRTFVLGEDARKLQAGIPPKPARAKKKKKGGSAP
jgi:hypothetical protein